MSESGSKLDTVFDPERAGFVERDLLPLSLFTTVFALPVLFILVKQPTFLKAHGLDRDESWTLAFGCGLVVPVLCWLLYRLFAALFPRGAWLMTVFFCLFLLQVQVFQTQALLACLLMSLVFAALFTKVFWVSKAFRWLFTVVLGLGWLASGVLFISSEDVRKAYSASSREAPPAWKFEKKSTPVFFFIFDQLPLSAMLTPEGEFNSQHFPNFANFANQSTWFRCTRSESRSTLVSVPIILSGSTEPQPGQSFINLFEATHEMRVHDEYHRVYAGESGFGWGRLKIACRSLASVLAIRYSPVMFHRHLPDLKGSWVIISASERRWELTQKNLLDIEGGTGRPLFYYFHNSLPHNPYRYRPGPELAYQSYFKHGVESTERGDYQRLFLQIQTVDQILGQIEGRLKSEGLWEDSLVVVTSDHGISKAYGTDSTETERHRPIDDYYVTLLVKEPGQSKGSLVKEETSLADVFSIIQRSLKGQAPWELKGNDFEGNGEPSLNFEALRASAAHKFSEFALTEPAGIYCEPLGSKWWGKSPPASSQHPTLAYTHRTRIAFASVSLEDQALPLDIAIELEGEVGPGKVLLYALNGKVCSSAPLPAFSGVLKLTSPIAKEHLKEGANLVDLYLWDPTEGELSWRKIDEVKPPGYRLDVTDNVILVDGNTLSVSSDIEGEVKLVATETAASRWSMKVFGKLPKWKNLLVFESDSGQLLANFSFTDAGDSLMEFRQPRGLELSSLRFFVIAQQEAISLRLSEVSERAEGPKDVKEFRRRLQRLKNRN